MGTGYVRTLCTQDASLSGSEFLSLEWAWQSGLGMAMSGRFPRLPETCQRHGKEVRTKTDRLLSIVEDHSTPEELARHLLQSAQPLEVAAGDSRAGLDLDADQLPSGIFKNDVHFQPGLRPKVK